MLYNDKLLINELKELGFKPAQSVKKSWPIMFEKHFQKYSSKNTGQVHRDSELLVAKANELPILSRYFRRYRSFLF
jgi:hypothetical protein